MPAGTPGCVRPGRAGRPSEVPGSGPGTDLHLGRDVEGETTLLSLTEARGLGEPQEHGEGGIPGQAGRPLGRALCPLGS